MNSVRPFSHNDNEIYWNIFQDNVLWDDIYPERKDFEEDIEKQTMYLAYLNEHLVAIYVISDECDEQYQNGQWRYDEKTSYTENPFAQRLYLHNGYESRGYASWRKGKFDLMEKKL